MQRNRCVIGHTWARRRRSSTMRKTQLVQSKSIAPDVTVPAASPATATARPRVSSHWQAPYRSKPDTPTSGSCRTERRRSWIGSVLARHRGLAAQGEGLNVGLIRAGTAAFVGVQLSQAVRLSKQSRISSAPVRRPTERPQSCCFVGRLAALEGLDVVGEGPVFGAVPVDGPGH